LLVQRGKKSKQKNNGRKEEEIATPNQKGEPRGGKKGKDKTRR